MANIHSELGHILWRMSLISKKQAWTNVAVAIGLGCRKVSEMRGMDFA